MYSSGVVISQKSLFWEGKKKIIFVSHSCPRTTRDAMSVIHYLSYRSHRTPEGGKPPGIGDVLIIGSGREHIVWCVRVF